MSAVDRLVYSRWAVPMAAFLIQLGQYWDTFVTITWWSERATMTVVWFCFLWLATCALLWIFLEVRRSSLVRCLCGAAVIAVVVAVAMAVIRLQADHPRLSLGPDEIGYLIITYVICMLIGGIVRMLRQEHEQEKQIERLKVENLSSQYNALANQISPHFLFNALSNLSSLIRSGRRDESLDYVQNLSGIFRYIIRFKQTTLTTLGEELSFIGRYCRLMNIRFDHNFVYEVSVPDEALDMRMPSLSLLPLFENVVKHNVIDSAHPMTISVELRDDCLIVSNPVYPKLSPAETSGIGLANLRNRYRLLLGKEIRVEHTPGEGGFFRVGLPMVQTFKTKKTES